MLKYIVNVMAILNLVGCSINDAGLVKLKYFENDTVRMVSKEAWGGHLSTDKTDAGLTFGHLQRIFLFPKNRHSIELSVDDILSKVMHDEFVEVDNSSNEKASNDPIAWVTNNQGMMLHTNQFQMGFKFGFEVREMIRLPRDFNGVFVIKIATDKKFQAYFYE